MKAIDAADRAISLPFPEFRGLPPNCMRIRVGVGNRLLFNQAHFLLSGYRSVAGLIKQGFLDFDAPVVDLGCGCGRLAYALRDFGFSGGYTGVDVDRGMIEWCRGQFPQDRYTFVHADMRSEVYNPHGESTLFDLPLKAGSQHLTIGQSLFTHLLERELEHYVKECLRVLCRGRYMYMGVFCIEDLEAQGTRSGRWTLEHRVGSAYVQVPGYPEAAVAYEKPFLIDTCERAGFEDARVTPRRGGHSLLVARSP